MDLDVAFCRLQVLGDLYLTMSLVLICSHADTNHRASLCGFVVAVDNASNYKLYVLHKINTYTSTL